MWKTITTRIFTLSLAIAGLTLGTSAQAQQAPYYAQQYAYANTYSGGAPQCPLGTVFVCPTCPPGQFNCQCSCQSVPNFQDLGVVNQQNVQNQIPNQQFNPQQPLPQPNPNFQPQNQFPLTNQTRNDQQYRHYLANWWQGVWADPVPPAQLPTYALTNQTRNDHLYQQYLANWWFNVWN